MKRLSLISILLFMVVLSGCHRHEWREATCEEPKTCIECGQTDGEPLGHDWIDATCTAPKECKICGKTDGKKADHEWDNGEITKEPSCAEHGEKKFTCIHCGAKKKETLEKPEHLWDSGETIEPTCTESGATTFTCKECGASKTDNKKPALGHDVSQTNGVCSRCGEIIYPTVSYGDVGDNNGPVIIEVIVSDVDIHFSDYSKSADYTLWYKSGDTYKWINDYVSILAVDENPALEAFKDVQEGSVIRFLCPVDNKKPSIEEALSMSIVDTIDINAVYQSVIQNTPVLNYNDVMRYPDNHYHEPAVITGSIFQTIGNDNYLVETGDGLVYVNLKRNNTEMKYLEDDTVTVFGEVMGANTYSTLIGSNTVPEMYAPIMIIQ